MPEWQEVDRLDTNYHFQRRTLPAPGSDAQLDEVVAELHAPMLDRKHPGWQVYLIDGLERNRFAVFIKIHHSLVDGESGIALVHRSLSRSPRDRRIRTVIATSLPGAARAVRKDLLPRLEREVMNAARTALSIGWGWERLLEESLAGLRGYSSKAIRPFTAPLTPMNEPIRNARAVAHTVLPLPAMSSVARASGTTLNDVALCVLDAAMHRYLRSIGRPAERALVAICPVSLHDPQHKQATTQVSVVLDAARPAVRVDRPAHAPGRGQHPRRQGAHPCAAEARGLHLRGAHLRAGRNARAAAARVRGLTSCRRTS